MNPGQPEIQPQQPTQYQQPAPSPYQQPPLTPEEIEKIRRSNKKKFVWGLVCLIAPTALLIIGILGFAIINFIFTSNAPTATSIRDGAAVATDSDVSIGKTIGNVVLFLIGAVSTITWLPGIIVGIILLATRKKI